MSTAASIRRDDVRHLISQPEGQRLEFKSQTPDVATISRILSAFANSDGGTLVVGVKEGGVVVGANVPQLLRVAEQARATLKPRQPIRLDTPTINGKQIGVVRIGRSPDGPVFADAGAFVRVGERYRPMSATELTQLLQQAPEPHDYAALATAIADQTMLIETLRLELREANSWTSKLKDYIIGAVIGAILGAIVSIIST